MISLPITLPTPSVMYEILDDLHKLAAEGKLSCQCGNMDVEVEAFEDWWSSAVPAVGHWES